MASKHPDNGVNIKPPGPCVKSTSPGNSIAMNDLGDIAMLCENGTLWIGNSRNKNDSKFERIIQLQSSGSNGTMEITTIEFNSSGSSLLLYGSRHIGVIDFPRMSRFTPPGGANCSYEVIKLMPDRFQHDNILRVKWHAYSSHHLVVLVDAYQPLLVVNTVTSVAQEFFLESINQFINFTFGPDLGWMRYTIFLTTAKGLPSLALRRLLLLFLPRRILVSSSPLAPFLVHFLHLCSRSSSPSSPLSSASAPHGGGHISRDLLLLNTGEVHFLCPIIPDAAKIDSRAVEQLWLTSDKCSSSFTSLQPRDGGGDGDRQPYSRLLSSFLFEAFGSRLQPANQRFVQMRAPTEIDEKCENQLVDPAARAVPRSFASREWTPVLRRLCTDAAGDSAVARYCHPALSPLAPNPFFLSLKGRLLRVFVTYAVRWTCLFCCWRTPPVPSIWGR